MSYRHASMGRLGHRLGEPLDLSLHSPRHRLGGAVTRPLEICSCGRPTHLVGIEPFDLSLHSPRLPHVKIVCLVKQVPRADSIEFDQETKQLKREGVPLLLNPFDAAAVAHAAKLKERNGGEVIAMTMGPPQAKEALRACLALGADRCIHLSDPCAGGPRRHARAGG